MSKSKLKREVSYDYVLYTDVDVYFAKLPFNKLPRYVGFAIQGDALYISSQPFSKKIHTNAGVMVLNVSSAKEWGAEFEAFLIRRIDEVNTGTEHTFTDQTAFHDFFPVQLHPSIFDYINLILFHHTYLTSINPKYNSNVLPKIYEWEPYLGMNEDAVVVHWHGPKLKLPNNCTKIYMNSSAIGSPILWDFTGLTKQEVIRRVEQTERSRRFTST